MLIAKFVQAGVVFIRVELEEGSEESLNIVPLVPPSDGFGTERFSPNQLREILRQCEFQVLQLGPVNTPQAFTDMLDGLRGEMTKREIPFDRPLPAIRIVIGPGPRLRRVMQIGRKYVTSFWDWAITPFKKLGLHLGLLEERELRAS